MDVDSVMGEILQEEQEVMTMKSLKHTQSFKGYTKNLYVNIFYKTLML